MSTVKKKENPVRRKEPRRHELCSCGSGLKAKDCCQKPAKKEGWFSTPAGDELVGAYNETVCKTGEDKYNRIIRYVKDLRPPGRNKIQLYCGCGLFAGVGVLRKETIVGIPRIVIDAHAANPAPRRKCCSLVASVSSTPEGIQAS